MSEEYDIYIKLSYDELLSDIERTAQLLSHVEGQGELGSEKITQLMRPSSVLPELLLSKAYQNASLQAQSLFG